MTVENWPDLPVVAIVRLTLPDGRLLTVNVPGRPLERGTRKPATVFSCGQAIPRDGVIVGGRVQSVTKRDWRSAVAEVELLVPLRTQITVKAV